MIDRSVPQLFIKTDGRRPCTSEALDHAVENLSLVLAGFSFCVGIAVLLFQLFVLCCIAFIALAVFLLILCSLGILHDRLMHQVLQHFHLRKQLFLLFYQFGFFTKPLFDGFQIPDDPSAICEQLTDS